MKHHRKVQHFAIYVMFDSKYSSKVNQLLKKNVTFGSLGQVDQFCCWASTFQILLV